VLTERHDVDWPFPGNGRLGELVHCLSGHVDKMIFALWLCGISIGNLEDDGSSFLLDVIEEVFWRVKDVQKEMDRLFFLGAIKKLKRGVAASDTSDVLPVDLEVVRETAESQCVLPSDPARDFSYVLPTILSGFLPTYHSQRPCEGVLGVAPG
jgi:hypothetical protein